MTRLFVVLAALLLVVPVHAVELKIATVAPDGSGWMRGMRAAAQTIREATQDRVILKFYPG